MTPEDWSLRFDQLLKLYLIDVDEKYYDESLPFTDPNELEYKFEALETQNLFYITQLQNMEEQLEINNEADAKKKAILDAEFNVQNNLKNEKENQIAIAKANLYRLGRATKTTIMDTNS